jgi:signal transduction histidine kinase
VNSDAGAIHLLDRLAGTLTLAIQQGLPPTCVADLETVPMQDNPVSRVLEQGKLLTTDNVADLQVIFPSSPNGLTMYVGLPMRASKQTIGVLSIFPHTMQAQLNAEEVTFLTAIADQAGVVAESARLRRRAKQAAVMEERERLARELHDSVTQSLYSLTLLTEWASDLLGVDRRDEVKQRLIEIGKIAQQALKEMRLLLYQLRPAELAQEGLIPALQHRLDAVERRTGVEVQLLADPAIKLSSPVEEGLYRIALEALNNTLKHAAASSVIVQLEVGDNGVTLTVQDNGVGFALDKANGQGRLGLISMRERAKQIDAALTIFSEPGQGTTVRVKIGPADQGQELTKIGLTRFTS